MAASFGHFPSTPSASLTDVTEQISIVLKGTIELSGPPCDYQTFLWRVCCVISYDLTKNRAITRNTQYLLASIVYEQLRFHSSLHAASARCVGPLIELVCPIIVKGYTEYPIETSAFPRVNTKQDITLRYMITEAKQLRIKAHLQLQACIFNDNFRDAARFKGYSPILPPSSEDWIVYFTCLDEKIASSGEYNLRELSSFISEGIEAITKKESIEPPSYIKRLYDTVTKRSKKTSQLTSQDGDKPFDAVKTISESSQTSSGIKWDVIPLAP